MSLKEIELRAQKYANQCSLNSEHYWGGGDLYDNFLSTRIFTSIMNKIFVLAPKIMRKVATASIWIC